MDAPSICFLCAPSMGLLDSWLPVLCELKRLRPNARLTMLIPRQEIVREIAPENVLSHMAAPLIDSILFPSLAQGWIRTDSFQEALDICANDPVSRLLQRAANRLRNTPLAGLSATALSVWARLAKGEPSLTPAASSEAMASFDALLMDIHEEPKEYTRPIMKAMQGVPKFSLCHGLDISLERSLLSDGGGFRKAPVRTYLYSNRQLDFYSAAYALPDKDMSVLGIPRHDPGWIQTIIDADQGADLFGDGEYVFIISRPGGSSFFPEDRRLQAIRDVKRLAIDHLGLKVVVKLHPKELNDGVYEKVFGKENLGRTWTYSTTHPFRIAKGAVFAVAFYSGVPIDMIAVGTPTIELLDLRSLEEWDNEESLRDHNGEPVHSIRYWGLVLGASDYESMRTWAEEILRDKSAVLGQLQKRYRELFAVSSAAAETIATEVLAACDG